MFPHLQYCMSVWRSCTVTQKRRLQIFLNFGARIATDLGYREHISGALCELGWRSKDMVTERDLCTMYRLIHDESAAVMDAVYPV